MVTPTEGASTTGEEERATFLARQTKRLQGRTVDRTFTRAEFLALVEGAEPATEDDVPWRFPVRTPLRPAPPS